MRKIFLIGKDISYSKSAIIQNAALKHLGYSDIVYENLDIQEADLIPMLNWISLDDNVLGANVTIPYKNKVSEYYDLDEPINCIYKRDETKFTSTDWMGAYKTISKELNLKSDDYQVLILGSGGVAESIMNKISAYTIFCYMFSRNVDKNTWIDLKPYSEFEEMNKFKKSLIINCTPLGTVGKFENESPVTKFKSNDIVFDLVYNPHKTKFLKLAEESGCKLLYGIDMLIYQAIYSLELFLNQKLNVSEIYQVMKKALDNPN